MWLGGLGKHRITVYLEGPVFEGYDREFKRLDCAVSNAKWRSSFKEATVYVLERFNPDHYLLLLDMNGFNRRRPTFRHFRFWAA